MAYPKAYDSVSVAREQISCDLSTNRVQSNGVASLNSETSTRVQVTTVFTEGDFDSLAAEWNEAVRRSECESVFLRHEWFRSAWAWRKLDSTLHVLVARIDRRIVGILPLVLRRDRSFGLRRAEFLTVPDTQFADVIVADADPAGCCASLADVLASTRNWDTLHLDFLQPDSRCVKFLLPALRYRRLHPEVRERSSNWYVDLDGSWTDYYASRSRSLKKTVNLAANRLARAGDVRIEWLSARSSSAVSLDRAIEAMIRISAQSWKRETGNSLEQPGPQAFIRVLTELSRKQEWLSLWLLYVGDEPLAMEYQLIDGKKIHALRSDFDAEHEELSPGTYLFRHLLEKLFSLRLSRYYLGPGDNPYKRRWTDSGEAMKQAYAYSRSVRGRLAWANEVVIRPLGRRLRDRMFKRATHKRDGNVGETTAH